MDTYEACRDTLCEDTRDVIRTGLHIARGALVAIAGSMVLLSVNHLAGTHQGPPPAFLTYARYAITACVVCALVYALIFGAGYIFRCMRRMVRAVRLPL